MTISVYKRNGKFTFVPGPGEEPAATVASTRDCTIDFAADTAIVAGVSGDPLTPWAFLLAAKSGYFGLAITAAVDPRLGAPEASQPPPRKGKSKS